LALIKFIDTFDKRSVQFKVNAVNEEVDSFM
jgi:hypothetical protein